MAEAGQPQNLAQLLLLLERAAIALRQAAIKLKEWIEEKKYGIVPSRGEYLELKRIGDQREFKELTGPATTGQKKIVRMGLRLREIERDQERVRNMKGVIQQQFGRDGVYLAQVVQSGAAINIRNVLVERGADDEALDDVMSDLLSSPRNFVLLATEHMDGTEGVEAQTIHTTLRQGGPPVFAVAASGNARRQAEEIARRVHHGAPAIYDVRVIEDDHKVLYLFSRRSD